MKEFGRIGTAILFLLAMPFGSAQTQINLANQSKDVDFSDAVSTRPVKVGTIIPAVCSLGDMFFYSAAPAGQNLYGCTGTNTWSQLSGGSSSGGASIASQLGDFNASNSGAAQTIGAVCNGANSCQIRTGFVTFSLTQPATATLSGTSSSGTAFWYLSSAQVLTVGYTSGATITCSASCSVASGIAAFPQDSIPLWQTTFTSNSWDVINYATMDKRAVFSRDVIAAGSGIASSYNPSTGVQTLSTDPTVVPRYFAGAGAPALTCTAGRDLYTDTANLHLYFCDGASTWKQADAVVPSRTDVENFPLAGDAPAGGNVLATYSSVAAGTFSVTGPNSIAYAVAGIPLAVNGAVMVTKKASPTWSGATGTVDVSIVASNADSAPAAGNWVLNIYAGCATASGAFTYGSASIVSAVPVGLNNFQTYQASAINLPLSCAANSPMQFWVQRGADTGGTTGVHPFLTSMEVVIRGN